MARNERPNTPAIKVLDARTLLVLKASPYPLKVIAMSDALPDRLSTNPQSPHYDEALLERGVGIRFNGAEKTNVEEYCVSEGWVRVVAGKSVDRKGNPMTIKLKGIVEPYVKEPAA
jgi:uncharacterized protein DUF3297